jgi:hypothetical protein
LRRFLHEVSGSFQNPANMGDTSSGTLCDPQAALRKTSTYEAFSLGQILN